jgi:hypothetical protein
MAECGTAQVRLGDTADRPLADYRPLVSVRLAPDRSDADSPAAEKGSRPDPIFASGFDPLDYLSGLVTDVEGIATIPALVPGLEYRISFVVANRWTCDTSEFRVASRREVRLPDVVYRADDLDTGADRQ